MTKDSNSFDLDGDEDLFIVNGYEFEARGPLNRYHFLSMFQVTLHALRLRLIG